MASFDFGSKSAYKFGSLGLVEANTNSVAIDTQGFEGIAVVASAGTGTLSEANNFTLNFLESDDTNISNATAVARVGSEAKLIETNSAVWQSVTPAKRYVFAQLIKGGSASANVAVLASLGYPHNAPTQ
jgi:hypothetical protein